MTELTIPKIPRPRRRSSSVIPDILKKVGTTGDSNVDIIINHINSSTELIDTKNEELVNLIEEIDPNSDTLASFLDKEINKIKDNVIIRKIITGIDTFITTNEKITGIDTFITTNEKITDKIKSYINNNVSRSYKGLTEYYGNENWKVLHNYREDLYNIICNHIKKVGDFNKLGSEKMNSDIDITIFKNGIPIVLYFCIGFGYYINKILDKKLNDNLEYIKSYLYIFQDTFDVVPYSTNGVIKYDNERIINSDDYQFESMMSTPMLKGIFSNEKNTTYQIIHDPKCERQRYLYLISAYISIYKIIQNHELLIQIGDIEINGTKVRDEALKLYKLEDGKDKLTKLKYQLYSTCQSDYVSKKLEISMLIDIDATIIDYVQNNKDKHNSKDNIKDNIKKLQTSIKIHNEKCFNLYCNAAYIWEYNQIRGNITTPEAAFFVQTFVSTVLFGQQGRIYELDMPYDSIWISLLENYYSIIHNEKHGELEGDLRKQYKYTQRCINLIYLLTSECKKFITKKGDIFTFEDNTGIPEINVDFIDEKTSSIEDNDRIPEINFDFIDEKTSSTEFDFKYDFNVDDKTSDCLRKYSIDCGHINKENYDEVIKGRIEKIKEFIKKHIFTTFLPVRIRFLEYCK